MNRIFALGLAILLAVALPAHDAEAKRLGGGGMRRSLPTQPAPRPIPPQAPQQAAPAKQAGTTPAAAPAPAPRRSWLGPVAGLAAGLGLAALASHFGFGAGLANLMTLLLLGVLAVVVVRFLMRRFAAPRPQMATANSGSLQTRQPVVSAAPVASSVASGSFDTAGFEKLAKQVFLRLQAANDAGDQADLRRFTTPQMYASIQHDLLERGGRTQRTEVRQLDANVVDIATENGQQVVSVRFWGVVREDGDPVDEGFDEIWHLVQSGDGWLIAGIQQTA